MKIFTLTLPENFDVSEIELKIIIAGELYERQKLSLSQAAQLAGLSTRAFIEIMGKHGFSLISKSEDDLIFDIENA
jgi:predicted HTH domain antitoxin